MKPYQKRLFKEFKELRNKCEKLDNFIERVKRKEVPIEELDCPVYFLERQLSVMVSYASILHTRISRHWTQKEIEEDGNYAGYVE